MNDKPVYKVITTNEIPELSVIEKSNIKAEITLGDTIKNLEENKKYVEKLQAEINLKKAIIENIKHHYPKVVKIDKKMQIACHTYLESKKFIEVGEDKLKEFDKANVELQEEIDEIKKQTCISKK